MTDIIFEDAHLIVANKPAGMPVVPDKTEDPSLLDELQGRSGQTLHPVHRIDRPVSGLVLFAKTAEAMTALTQLWQQRQVRKEYLAVVATPPPEDRGTLVHYVEKKPKGNKARAYSEEQAGADKSTLHYQFLNRTERYILLSVLLETGRHHQIRAQLSAIGSPIKGDVKYGARRSNPDRSIHLHAWKIAFQHPFSRKMIQLQAKAPEESLWNALLSSIP